MTVPLTRNASAENIQIYLQLLAKELSIFLHKTTKRYSFRKIFEVLSIILRLQKRGTEFLGSDHSCNRCPCCHHCHRCHCCHCCQCFHRCHNVTVIDVVTVVTVVTGFTVVTVITRSPLMPLSL